MKNLIMTFMALSMGAAPALFAPPAAEAAEAAADSSGGQTACVAKHVSEQEARDAIKGWGKASRSAGEEMISRYGSPDYTGCQTLLWENKGGFNKIVVDREGTRHSFSSEHQDVLSQEVNMRVPADKVADLNAFNGSLVVDRTRGTVTARGDSEAHNILALNIANDIISGKRDAASARQFYADESAKGMAGKTSAYASGLNFSSGLDTADPDVAVMPDGARSRRAASRPHDTMPARQDRPLRELPGEAGYRDTDTRPMMGSPTQHR